MQRDAFYGVGCRHAGLAMFAVVSLAMTVSFVCGNHSFAADDGDAQFADGWRKEVALTDPAGGDKKPHCVAWVDDGWLVVERRDTAGDVEWQIVLAEAGAKDEPPTVEPKADVPGGVRVDYRGGRYFIHDDWGHLRCRRQKKSADAPWPSLEIPQNEPEPGGAMMGHAGRTLYGRTKGGWQFVACGLADEKAEFVLRMYCLDLGDFQLSSHADRHGPVTYTVGKDYGSVSSSTLWDDGELFVARRMHEGVLNLLRGQLEQSLAKRKELIGAAPPAIFAAKWLNGDPVALDDLKGKTALVYFPGQFSKQIADQLSAIDELFGKYHDRGLEIAAVIPAGEEEVYAAICEKRGWRFSLAVDRHGGPVEPILGGPTAQRFFITDAPCYFLIGRDGKIASSEYQGRAAILERLPPPPLPGPEEVDRLLDAKVKQ